MNTKTVNALSASLDFAPLVSIVILSFNSRHLLPQAIESVIEQTHPRTELIIVDNGSTDGTAELLDTYRDRAQVVLLNENTGYARGMNRGYEISCGEFFIPLNTDAVLHPDFIAEAITLFNQHERLGVVAAEVLKIPASGEWRFWREPQQIYESEGGIVALTRNMRVCVIADETRNLRVSFKANGACPVIRRRLLEDMERGYGVAAFDEVFDTYGEDVDFAFKAWALRWETLYAPRVRAGHVRSYASPIELPDKRGRLRTNLVAERYINAVRHLPAAKLCGVLLRGLAEDARLIVRQQRKGDTQVVADVRQALVRVFRLLPRLVRFRRRHRTWRRIDFEREVYCERL